MVYVISKNGKPLMPTRDRRKVRLLLKAGKAVVARQTPFTIQVVGTSHQYCQPITLGIDAGSVHIGFSASTEKKELYSTEIKVCDDVNKNLAQRRTLRSARRNRTTRYRKPRFDNRKRMEGCLTPSTQAKTDLHLRMVSYVRKIANPDIEGVDYQYGPLAFFENVKQYVRFRDESKCRACHGKSGDKRLEVHHLVQRKDGGPDRPDNLVTLCHTCHQAYHDGKITLGTAVPGNGLRHMAFMGLDRRHVADTLRAMFPETHETYGYVTKIVRKASGNPIGRTPSASPATSMQDAWTNGSCRRRSVATTGSSTS